jgi:hydroxymethylglutaryl-CoA lyase
MSIDESLAQVEAINKEAARNDISVRSAISTCFGCPMEGHVPPEKVADIAFRLEEFGSYEVCLGDTTGMANPISAYEVPKLVLSKLKRAQLSVHFHRADGIEFANILASLEAGVTLFDSAAGGLGGCPYAPGATGNIATETLVEIFHRMGISTGIDIKKIRECGEFARRLSAYEQAVTTLK